MTRVIARKVTGFGTDLTEQTANHSCPDEGFGIHEVIVETPDHSLVTASLPEAHLINMWHTAKARYDEVCRDPRIAYATILLDILRKFYFGLEDPDFSYSIRNAPVASVGVAYHHWCLNLVPILPALPGLGHEGKMCPNPVLPEDAAQYLRAPYLREVCVQQAIPA